MGDRVLAHDAKTGELSYDKVTDVIVHTDPVVEHLTIDDETLTATAEHPFFTKERGSCWLPASSAQNPDRISDIGDHDCVVAFRFPQSIKSGFVPFQR